MRTVHKIALGLLAGQGASALNAAFTVDDSAGDAPHTVTVTNTSTGASSYYWDWGDGFFSVAENPPPHTYPDVANYTITLHAYDAALNEDTATAEITVSLPAPSVPTNLRIDGVTTGSLTNRQPTLSCDPVPYAETYRWQYDDNSSFTSPATVETAVPVYVIPSDVPIGALYVRVQSENATDTSAYTAAVSVSVDLLVETFQQVVSETDLLDNPLFANWTGDNPDNWTVTGESGSDPMVTETAADGSAGTGSAQFISSATANVPTVSQASKLTVGQHTEIVGNLSQRTSGSLRTYNGAANIRPAAKNLLAVAGQYRLLDLPTTTTLLSGRSGSGACSFVLDELHAYLFTTLNTVYNYGTADHIQFKFAESGSPYFRENVQLRFRYADEDNYLRVMHYYDEVNSWVYRFEKVVSGTVTQITAVNNTGAIDTIRVEWSGNAFTIYTGVGGSFTKRTDAVEVTDLSANTSVHCLYSSTFTPEYLAVGTSYFEPLGIPLDATWYVDPDSVVTPETGLAAAPFTSLKTALENPALLSGDIVAYTGTPLVDATINITASGITIRPYTGTYSTHQLGAGAFINFVGNDNIWLDWDCDGIDTDRTTEQAGSAPTDITVQGIRFVGSGNTVRVRMNTNINGSGGFTAYGAEGTHIYGGVQAHNGWLSTVDGRHGHNLLYTQNDPGAEPVVVETMIGANPFHTAFKIGGTGAAQNSEYTITDVVILDGVIYCSWVNPAEGVAFDGLDFWNGGINIPVTGSVRHALSITDCVFDTTGYCLFADGILTLTQTGNKFARRDGFVPWYSLDTDAELIAALTSDNNAFYAKYSSVQAPRLRSSDGGNRLLADFVTAIGTDGASTATADARLPDQVKVVEIGTGLERCIISIHNAVAQAANVTTPDLSSILVNGHDYILRYGQDPRNDTVTFTFNSGAGIDNGDGTLDINMQAANRTVATPTGLSADMWSKSCPDFAAVYIELDL